MYGYAPSIVGQSLEHYAAHGVSPERLIRSRSEADARNFLNVLWAQLDQARTRGLPNAAALEAYFQRLSNAFNAFYGAGTTTLPSGPATTPPVPPPPQAPAASRGVCATSPYCRLYSIDLAQAFGVRPGTGGLFAEASPTGQRVYRNGQVPAYGYMVYAVLDDGTKGWMDPYELANAR